MTVERLMAAIERFTHAKVNEVLIQRGVVHASQHLIAVSQEQVSLSRYCLMAELDNFELKPENR